MQIAHLLAVSIAPFATISELTRWFADVFYFWHVGSLILEFNKFDTLVHSVLKAWFVLLPLKQWRRAGIRRVSKKIHSENDGSVDCGWKYPYQFCCQKITKNWQKTGSDDFEKSHLFFTKVLSWRGWRTIINDLSMCVSSRECWRVKIVLSLMWGKFWNISTVLSSPQAGNLKCWNYFWYCSVFFKGW